MVTSSADMLIEHGHRSQTMSLVAQSATAMTGCPELTVEVIVADPMVRALISAHRIDPAAFLVHLTSIGSKSYAFPEWKSVAVMKVDRCAFP